MSLKAAKVPPSQWPISVPQRGVCVSGLMRNILREDGVGEHYDMVN